MNHINHINHINSSTDTPITRLMDGVSKTSQSIYDNIKLFWFPEDGLAELEGQSLEEIRDSMKAEQVAKFGDCN